MTEDSALRRLLVLLLLSASAATAQNPEASDPPLRVKVKLVNVAFSARDAKGALITDLTKNDVEVTEDTIPQKISFFARSTDMPLTLGLIIDDSGSQGHFSKQHEHDVRVFLDNLLRPQDRVFMISFGNTIRLVSDLTNSGAEIEARMEEYRKGPRRKKKSKNSDDNEPVFPVLGPDEDRELGTAFYDSIYYAIHEKLANETGRRALLVFSDGEDNSSSHDLMTAIEEAQAANVLVENIRYTEIHHGKLNARNRYGISVLDRIARESGGMHIDASAVEPQTFFKQIAEELRNSFELAYYPTNATPDGTFRKIKIKPKQEGTTIRSRTGYFSPLPQ
jgi:Ca-activated chloride channel family protein